MQIVVYDDRILFKKTALVKSQRWAMSVAM